MPYHVEVRRSRQHARVFNLDEAELRQAVVEPWVDGRALLLGGYEWTRRDARLRILEGPELAPADLAHGQGWGRAERVATDVTAALLAAAVRPRVVAVLAPGRASHAAVAAVLAQLGLEVGDWATVRAAVLAWGAEGDDAARPPADAVVIACEHEPPAWWLFDAGLARGAFGPRAVLAQCDDGPPPDALRGAEASVPLGGLAERLRRIGFA